MKLIQVQRQVLSKNLYLLDLSKLLQNQQTKVKTGANRSNVGKSRNQGQNKRNALVRQYQMILIIIQESNSQRKAGSIHI